MIFGLYRALSKNEQIIIDDQAPYKEFLKKLNLDTSRNDSTCNPICSAGSSNSYDS